MRYLALDWGKKHIGIAKGDDRAGIAFPAGVLFNTGRLIEELKLLCQQEDIGGLVIGIPHTLRGGVGPQAKEVLAFVDKIKMVFTLPVFLEDERFTTKIASKIFGSVRRTHADAIAASLILQSFFDRHRQARNGANT